MRVARFSSTPWKQPYMAAPNNVQLVQKEGRIALAIEAFKNGYFSRERAFENMYNIPETTLRRRVKEGNARCNSVPIN